MLARRLRLTDPLPQIKPEVQPRPVVVPKARGKRQRRSRPERVLEQHEETVIDSPKAPVRKKKKSRPPIDVQVLVDPEEAPSPDWALGADVQLKQLADELSSLSSGLHDLRRAWCVASSLLNAEELYKLLEIIMARLGRTQACVHSTQMGGGAILAAADPAWGKLVERPKIVPEYPAWFLHLGNAPSKDFFDVFHSHCWKGICVGPDCLPCDYQDVFRAVTLNPMDPCDERAFAELAAVGLEFGPPVYDMVYINSVFAGDEFPPMESLPAIGPWLAPSRGLWAVRLRAFRDCLHVAIERLAEKGMLVVVWPGPPDHPVLLFLMAHFRLAFERVHIISGYVSKALEVYILAVGFKRRETEDRGSKASILRRFICHAQRTAGYDDVMCWCLIGKTLKIEYEASKSEYDRTWRDFAKKITNMAEEIHKYGGEAPSLPVVERRTGTEAMQGTMRSSWTKLPPVGKNRGQNVSRM